MSGQLCWSETSDTIEKSQRSLHSEFSQTLGGEYLHQTSGTTNPDCLASV